MDEKCSSSGCLKPVEFTCDCLTPKIFLCESHLSWHISSRKKASHSAKRIEQLQDSQSKDCQVCLRKPAKYLCLCRTIGVKLCPECFDLHSVQNPGRHIKEPIEASDFIKEEKDVMFYVERREQIDSILKVVNENQRELQTKEEIFRISTTLLCFPFKIKNCKIYNKLFDLIRK